jgi:hypothetical protein
VFAFSVNGVADCCERLGERKNVARNKQIGILCSDRMPVDTLSSNGNLGHQIGPTECDPFCCRATQRDPADYSVFCSNLLLIEELTELLSLGIGRNRRRKSNSKTLRASSLNTFACARPSAGPAMKVVQFWRGAVQADLQDNSIAGQGSQAFCAASGK